ncbi:nitrate/nitrite response regulator protein NarP [Erwinia sp. HR93]|uniref:nitrate/nitrite response regulator protein NarP n=1 Tax=Erwinia sp. HR93 TaxID=3094840 RepID=UPI002ADEA617|nr:nitrate/nitrite response regulator protein NarP [Erwinia sp. HR93]MEA1065649.1 nitrate/nitrite response regulator protein NarP [Erwinia sp. HR93]
MPHSHCYQVLIVDDHPLMRRGLHQLLQNEPSFNVVGEASSGAEAISMANRLTPDLILLDLNMKGLSGLDTLQALRRDGISARIIVLTVSDAASDVYALIDAGADGYLLKDSDPDELLQAILHGAQNQEAFSEKVREYLATRESKEDEKSPLALLTSRELDVLQELGRGMSNKEIAAALFISEETVKVHIRNVLRKLNVRSRVAATVMYLESRHS